MKKVLLLASVFMLWPSVLSATFEIGTVEEVCAPRELEYVRTILDDCAKPEICVKLSEPPPDLLFPRKIIDRLKAHLAEREMKMWLEACTPYWENRLPDGPPDP